MKLNFGHGILAILLLFMSGMSYLVYKCSQQPIGLVSPEYYAQELKYSEQMNKEKNAKALGEKVDISFSSPTDEVVVKYPVMNENFGITGEILFFKPDNGVFDFSVPVKADENSRQQISASKLPHGAWRVKINWQLKGTSYYSEEKIFIN